MGKNREVKNYYTAYFPHSRPASERREFLEFTRFVSVDPGKRNYALRVEDRYADGRVEKKAYHRVDILCEQNFGDHNFQGMYNRLTEFLDSLSDLWPLVRVVIVEKQPVLKRENICIAQHTISYFSLRLHDLPLLPEIYEINTHLKGDILQKPRGMDTKVWSIALAREMFLATNDQESLAELEKEKKKDDLADTKIQIEALVQYWQQKTQS